MIFMKLGTYTRDHLIMVRLELRYQQAYQHGRRGNL
jgi:hypothetical protein